MVLHENLESNSSARSYLPSASARSLKIRDSSDLTEILFSMELRIHILPNRIAEKLIRNPKQPWDNPHASEKKA
ncbi:hypothetical protein GcC1_025021 [Golovinomyces cichoracearum]|uniref:Uncharacterized protein n=1 Tax=Golovinomyces cichoracearum TaxID=62708 RepID=A0A420J3V7_9PEZI|nr:hypothetical protein GcC1_025021 [Golovinomyces cichoracearum]